MGDARRSSGETSGSCEREGSNDLYSQGDSSTSSFSTIIDPEYYPKEDNGNSLVIPATSEKLPDPGRWRRLESTPSKSPLKGRFMIPDPSPAPSTSDTDSVFTAKESPSSFSQSRRRGEHVARPPIWKLFDPTLARQPKLARAWPLALTAGKENSPLQDSSRKKIASSDLRTRCSSLEWLVDGYLSDDPRFGVGHRTPLIVNMMAEEDPANPNQESPGKLLPAKAYKGDEARRSRIGQGSSEAQNDATATPSVCRSGTNTDQQGTVESQIPLTRPSDTPSDGAEVRESDPVHGQRGTIDDGLPRLRQHWTDFIKGEEYQRRQSEANYDRLSEQSLYNDNTEGQAPQEQVQQAQLQTVLSNESGNPLDQQYNGPHQDHGPEASQDLERSQGVERVQDFNKDSRAYRGLKVQQELRNLIHQPLLEEQRGDHVDTSIPSAVDDQCTVSSDELRKREQEAEENMLRNIRVEPHPCSAAEQEAEENMLRPTELEHQMRSKKEQEAGESMLRNVEHEPKPRNATTPDRRFLQRARTSLHNLRQRLRRQTQSGPTAPANANASEKAHSLPSRSVGNLARDSLFQHVGVPQGFTEPSRQNPKQRTAVHNRTFGPEHKQEIITHDSAGAPSNMTAMNRQPQRDQILARSGQETPANVPDRIPDPADDKPSAPRSTVAATCKLGEQTIFVDGHGLPIARTPLDKDPQPVVQSITPSRINQQILSRPANTNDDPSQVEEAVPLTRTRSHRPSNPFNEIRNCSYLPKTSSVQGSPASGHRRTPSYSAPDFQNLFADRDTLSKTPQTSSIPSSKGKQPQSYHGVLKSISDSGKWSREEAERASNAARKGVPGRPPTINEDRGHPPIPQTQAPARRSMLNISEKPVPNGFETVGVHHTTLSDEEDHDNEGERTEEDEDRKKKKGKKSIFSWMAKGGRRDRKDDDEDKKGRKKDRKWGNGTGGGGGGGGNMYESDRL